ncbi:MAG: hypothetical protein ABSH07_10910 [Candidatus Dormibacteria bacterium]|jgi:hypothetical protein
MEERKSKRSGRLALVLGAAVAGTALVGWGGLAAWQAYTQNAGNAFAVGTLSHTNQVTGSTLVCDSTLSSATPGACSVIVGGPVGTPEQLTSDFTGTFGKVTITNTGSLSSTFSMSMPAAPSGGALCSDLTLSVNDTNGYYYGTSSAGEALNAQMTPAIALNNASGSATWAQTDANTFTFTINPTTGYSDDTSVLNTSCSFTILFDQASA